MTYQALTPEHAAYDHARAVFAAHIDRRPALIARVEGPGDIARVIAQARETGSELAVRGGGHSPAGHGVSDAGIVIDLSALHEFTFRDAAPQVRRGKRGKVSALHRGLFGEPAAIGEVRAMAGLMEG